MNPHSLVSRSRGSGARGSTAPSRGGRGKGRGSATEIANFNIGDHITTIGVKRPGFGDAGRPILISVNAFETTIPENVIHHYDVIFPTEKALPASMNMQLLSELQKNVAPQVFTPPAVYDGRKNVFSARELPFGDSDSKEFEVALNDRGKSSKVYRIKLTKVAEINPEVLKRFVAGEQSQDNAVFTAITALNVVIRMEPSMKYPFNVRSFFTSAGKSSIGSGIELWRGYFQSVRPAVGRMLINVDISTAAMFKSGSLMGLCCELFATRDPVHRESDQARVLTRALGNDRDRIRLERFISGIRVEIKLGAGVPRKVPRVVKRISPKGANNLRFNMRVGEEVTVAEYFKKAHNITLKYPDLNCVEVGSGALIPLELCEVPPGQIMRKQIPPHKTKDVISFATKKPLERLRSIREAHGVLAYGQSEYVRQFGMDIKSIEQLKVKARVLPAPRLQYREKGKQKELTPQHGSWNMIDKQFIKPVEITNWAIISYETETRFSKKVAAEMAQGLVTSCQFAGIKIGKAIGIKYISSFAIGELALRVQEFFKAIPPTRPLNLLVVVLPENAGEIYATVKFFGDVQHGIVTQCLKSTKCLKANNQYFSNVSLKINVKLGGTNTIVQPQPAGSMPSTVKNWMDPSQPTIIMGADVVHPAPGSDNRPSFAALVSNVDPDAVRYIAESSVQPSRQEMIIELKEMSKNILQKYMDYRNYHNLSPKEPTRIIFYRDGVSEGQFKQVLELELPLLKEACQELKINPTITLVVVGKRHHIRLFPVNTSDGDNTGNCPAGTVVDREISHPTEFDFYLQSHGGILGTSRPAHYSVLYDQNNFSPDVLQSFSYALCYVYARSTRSVSIPAPVYYADIVCSRAKNHYDWNSMHGEFEKPFQDYRDAFKAPNKNQEKKMYFSAFDIQ